MSSSIKKVCPFCPQWFDNMNMKKHMMATHFGSFFEESKAPSKEISIEEPTSLDESIIEIDQIHGEEFDESQHELEFVSDFTHLILTGNKIGHEFMLTDTIEIFKMEKFEETNENSKLVRKSVQCYSCEKTFRDKSQMRTHYIATHTNSTFNCKGCATHFKYAKELRSHVKRCQKLLA